MNKWDEDELDAFLWEVEKVSKGVHDIIEGKVDIQKIMETERVIKERKEKEEQMKKFKEQEAKRKQEDLLKQGEKGKGEKDDYLKLCKICFVQYKIEIQKCTHCGQETITKEARHKELKEKVEELKSKKVKKKFRRQKYENWVKTEAVMKCDTLKFQNYQKWDLYESSTDEEEKGEPILPRNDPNFLALEKDMIEGQKKRDLSKSNAIRLKDEGNQALKANKFRKAVRLYTEAMEEFRGMMTLYTNRAFAYLKLEEYDNAITDCDRVIEYLDVFDEELTSNKEIYVKALTRKSQALQKLKDYSEAKLLLSKAVKIIDDAEIKKLLEVVELEEQTHNKTIQTITGDSKQFQQIDNFITLLKGINSTEANQIKKEDLDKVVLLLKICDNNKYYFLQKAGIELVASSMQKFPILLQIIEVFNEHKAFILLLNTSKVYSKLVQMLHKEKEESKESNSTNNDTSVISNAPEHSLSTFEVKKITGILEDASQQEEVRKTLSGLKYLDKLFVSALEKYDISKSEVINDSDSVIVLMRLFTLVCNINYASQTARDKFVSLGQLIFTKLNKFTEIYDFTNTLHVNILEAMLSFLINLSCDQNFRNFLIDQKDFFSFLIKDNLKKVKSYNLTKYEDLVEKCMSLMYNASYRDNLVPFYLDEGLAELVQDLVISGTKADCLLRLLMIAAKLTKLKANGTKAEFINKLIEMTSVQTTETKIVDNTIKILAHFLTHINKPENKSEQSQIKLTSLVDNLCPLLLKDCKNFDANTERIVNNMSLLISLITNNADHAKGMKSIVDLVISIAKDKVDLLRKNAAILLAKVAKSSDEMQDYVRSLHGMDVLMSVAKFIKV